MKTIVLLAFTVLCMSISANAQFEVNNDAIDLGGNVFQLTPDSDWRNGSVWYKVQHDLNNPLSVQGQFNFGSGDDGADGIVFVLQNNCLAAGTAGQGIGYGGLTGNSLGVEFDTFENSIYTDPTYDHIAVHQMGNVDHAVADNLDGPYQMHASQTDVEDGTWYDFQISYDPSTTLLEVYFDGVLRISYNIDIQASIFAGDPYVYWGFTSATGGFYNANSVYIDQSTTFAIDDDTICTGSTTVTLPSLTKYLGENMALGKTTNSSSNEGGGSGPPRSDEAFDGNMGTRWSSAFSDPQWISIDFGGMVDIDSVKLYWEGAYGSEYIIQTSTDNVIWTDQFHETTGNGGLDEIYFSATNVRYIRMYGIQRATGYGYSLWEFEVYGLPKYTWTPDDGTIDDVNSATPTFTPSSTTTYTVMIPDPCSGAVPFDYTVNIQCPMPVDLTYFDASKINQSVNISWQTISEVNSDYFVVLRSYDGISFDPIGSLEAAENSTSVLNYSFTDHNPGAEIVYYRLEQVDMDGTKEYSDIRSVNFGFSQSVTDKVFKDRLEFVDADLVVVRDLLGRTLEQVSGKNIHIGTTLPAGIYIIELYANGMKEIFKAEKIN